MEKTHGLAILRKKRGLTASMLAQELEVSRACISMYENGKRIPARNNAYKLAIALNVPVLEIMACFYKKPDEVEL